LWRLCTSTRKPIEDRRPELAKPDLSSSFAQRDPAHLELLKQCLNSIFKSNPLSRILKQNSVPELAMPVLG
jgi:hypothetical protein